MFSSSLRAGTLFVIAVSSFAAAQQRVTHCSVTFCTSAQIYFDAGRDDGLSVGDTLLITRHDTSIGTAVLTALSSHSSVGRLTPSPLVPRAGDTGTIIAAGNLTGVPGDSAATGSAHATPLQDESGVMPRENVLSGRLAFQYNGQSAEDARLNISQPALYARANMRNLGGTGMTLSFYGREYYDAGGPYLRYGDSTHSRLDLSELSLGFDNQASPFGFSAGRFISRYITGVGPIDGGELFVRQGEFTAGALAGSGVQSRVLGYGGAQRSLGAFLAYHRGDSLPDSYDASAAYVRQTLGGTIDRTFVSVQNSLVLGTRFNAYAGADLELEQMTSGIIAHHPSLSSILVFVNYSPASWLSTNFGYDGTRPVYLFASMRSTSDSLFHQALDHGFRLNGTVRLGMNYFFTGEASIASSAVDGGSTHRLGAGIRVTDIFSTRVFGSVRYRTLGGSFLSGSQSTVELGRSFFQRLDVTLQYDTRSYTVDLLKQTYTTQTFSGNANFWISRNIYGTLGADYVLDNTMNGLQYFLEIGYRF